MKIVNTNTIVKATLALCFISCLPIASIAQDSSNIPADKHSVTTNRFWDNWFIQANIAMSSFYSNQESTIADNGIYLSGSPFKAFRNNVGFSIAIGKWFTPGLGLRTKLNGAWGRTVISNDASYNANKYWTLQEQILFNITNMIKGYNENRTWNAIPYLGFGIGHNMRAADEQTTSNPTAMGITLGLLNTWRLTDRMSLNLDFSYGIYEGSLDAYDVSDATSHGLKNTDRILNLEVGITYNLSKKRFKRAPDVNALNEINQSEIEAINSQLQDALQEADRLRQELDKKKKQ